MTKIVTLIVILGTLLFSVPAVSGSVCLEVSQDASKAAQQYRNALNKVKTACNTSFNECNLQRAEASEALELLNAANNQMLVACVFIDPDMSDELPFTAATVEAAMDMLPDSVAIQCFQEGGLSIGCPNGWTLNAPRSNVIVSNASADSFAVSMDLGVSASVPVSYLSLSCTLTVGTSTGVPVMGTATFSSSELVTYFNRLQFGVNSIGLGSIEFSGCGGLAGVVADVLFDLVSDTIVNATNGALAQNLCGAVGPELFGPCP